MNNNDTAEDRCKMQVILRSALKIATVS